MVEEREEKILMVNLNEGQKSYNMYGLDLDRVDRCFWGLFVIFSLFCVNPVIASDQVLQWEQEIEFDGGYVKSHSGTYLEIKEKKATKTDDSSYSITDKESMASISMNAFQGFVLKGMHHFDSVSLHSLVEMSSGGKTQKFYVPDKEIDIRKKSLGSDSYYFQPRTPLQAGEYVLKTQNKFWLFELKAEAVQSLPKGASADLETLSFMAENRIEAVSTLDGVGLFFHKGRRRREPIPCGSSCTFKVTEEMERMWLSVSTEGKAPILYDIKGRKSRFID